MVRERERENPSLLTTGHTKSHTILVASKLQKPNVAQKEKQIYLHYFFIPCIGAEATEQMRVTSTHQIHSHYIIKAKTKTIIIFQHKCDHYGYIFF